MSSFIKATSIGTGGARTLEGKLYTSPEIFARERERIFGARWICVGRAEEIAEPGQFLVREVAGESIVVLRDRSTTNDGAGDVRAFFNVCRHRGSRLCTESAGKVTNSIQCPYHAWTYALDGRLLGAPSMDGVADFDRRDYPLHSVGVALWEGFLFVSLASEPMPFEQAFAPLMDKFTSYNLPKLRSIRRIDYDVRANWKLIFQNYSECYHCATVHPELVKLSPSDSGENDLTSGPFLGGFMTLPDAEGLSRTGRQCAIPVGDLCAEDLRRVYYYSIFPNLLLSLHADYVMVHTIWPVAVDRTLIECQWYFHPEADSKAGFNPDDGVTFWDTTNRQDWHVCELSQMGVSSRAYTPGPYSPRESISAAFDREYLKALGDDR